MITDFEGIKIDINLGQAVKATINQMTDAEIEYWFEMISCMKKDNDQVMSMFNDAYARAVESGYKLDFKLID